MPVKALLVALSLFSFVIFTLFSFTVAKEVWQQSDFDTTVKLQDHISRRWDGIFSYLTFLGSVELTVGITLILAFLYLIRGRFWASFGWMLMIPASFFEIFGKLTVFHPGPPQFFHRNTLNTPFPSFYVHTNFSYPSGHMTRTIFLVTVFVVWLLVSKKSQFSKIFFTSGLIVFASMMALTRIYLGEHWLSDVIGGSLLGLASGLFASALIIRKSAAKIG